MENIRVVRRRCLRRAWTMRPKIVDSASVFVSLRTDPEQSFTATMPIISLSQRPVVTLFKPGEGPSVHCTQL